MAAPYSPAAVANDFLERAGKEGKAVTPMQLLKLVYTAHGWHMAVNGPGKVLFDEPVQAWKYGPVVPSLFHEFKRFGGGPVTTPAYVGASSDDFVFEVEAPFLPKHDTETGKLIDWVWKGYGHLSGWQLSEMTHRAGTPWSQAWKPDLSNVVIDNEMIRRHYMDLWASRNDGAK